MYDYLQDTEFLQKLDNMKIKTQYIKLILLDFVTEEPIQEVQGIALSGAITVNSTAAIRRTLTLVLWADEASNNIENVENLIALNSKIKIFVGLKNPFYKYANYGDIIWFPQGVFIVNSAQFTRSNTGCNISIQGRDKMVLLDGSVGGGLPASTTFSERFIYQDDGSIVTEYPTLYQIIKESVHHLGAQPLEKIIISDLEETAKLLVKYMGDTPIWFSSDFSSFVIADSPPAGFEKNKYTYGQDVGYEETDFTYPGELTLNAGSSVKQMLDKICEVLGNFEFFFDLDGNFVFQEIKNYQRVSYTPIVNLEETSYIKDFSDDKFMYALTDANTVVSYQNSPRYADVKNDFVVWGKRTTESGAEVDIRYHLAVDVKPILDLARYDMYEIYQDEEFLRYEYVRPGETCDIEGAKLLCTSSTEWREELYRQALERAAVGEIEEWYDAELRAEWRKLYDPMNKEWQETWQKIDDLKSIPFTGWNPAVYVAPQSLDYWLDFIDSTDAVTQYSVNMIGRRTKAVNDNNVKSIYNMEVPDVIFVENPNNADKLTEMVDKFRRIGQPFCMLQNSQLDYFQASSTPKSAYDAVRELLYKHLTYNATVTINCQPKYYLEPNNLIYIEDRKSGIVGNYIITQFSIPLNYSGTMNLVAVESLTRV